MSQSIILRGTLVKIVPAGMKSVAIKVRPSLDRSNELLIFTIARIVSLWMGNGGVALPLERPGQKAMLPRSDEVAVPL